MPIEPVAAGIYTRYSTPAQGETSEKRQVDGALALVDRLGARLHRVYADRGLTGTSLEGRAAVEQLLADAAAGLIKILVVERIDRVARNMAVLRGVYKRLVRYGVELYEVSGTRVDKVSMVYKGMLAVEERANFLNRTAGGRKLAIGDGKIPFRIRYGHVADPHVPGVRHLRPQQAEVVRRIFLDFDAGYGRQEIADGLTGREPTPRDYVNMRLHGGSAAARSVWTAAMVTEILRCPLYACMICDRRTQADKVGTRVVGYFARPSEDHVDGVAAAHLEIVEPALAQRVRDRLDGDARAESSSKLLLTGRIHCGRCGRELRCFTQGGKRRYACPGERDRTCEGIGRPTAAVLEGVVIAKLGELAGTDFAETYRDAFEAALRSSVAALAERRARLEGQIEDLLDDIARARETGAAVGFSGEIVDEFCAGLTGQLRGAKAALAALPTRAGGLEPGNPVGLDLREGLAAMARRLPFHHAKSPADRRLMAVVRRLVSRAAVNSGRGQPLAMSLDLDIAPLLGADVPGTVVKVRAGEGTEGVGHAEGEPQ